MVHYSRTHRAKLKITQWQELYRCYSQKDQSVKIPDTLWCVDCDCSIIAFIGNSEQQYPSNQLNCVQKLSSKPLIATYVFQLCSVENTAQKTRIEQFSFLLKYFSVIVACMVAPITLVTYHAGLRY